MPQNAIREPRRRRNRRFRAPVVGYAFVLAATAAIDTLLWGWVGLIATSGGGFAIFVLLFLIGRRSSRAR